MREFAVVLALLGLSLAVELENYQLCSSSSTGVYVTFPEYKDCMQPPRDEHVLAKVRLFTPSTGTTETPAYACMLVNTTQFNLNSIFGSGSATRLAYSVDPAECILWNRDLTARGETLKMLNEGMWVSDVEDDFVRPFEWFGDFFNVTNYILMRGIVSSMDGRTLFSNLGDFGNCMDTAMTKKFCRQKDRTIIFDTLPFNDIDTCIHKPIGVFDAMLSEEFILINDFQMALAYADTPNQNYAENCFGPGTKLMDNGFLLQFVNESQQERHRRDVRPYWNTPNQTNFSPFIYELNSRANMLFYKFRQLVMKRFDELWVSICELHNQHVDLVETFMRVDPTMAMRLWLGRDDFVASVHGDVVMLTGCHAVKAAKVYLNHTISGVCFLYLPVLTADGKVMFALPGSRDLILESPTVDCKERVVPVYIVEGEKNPLIEEIDDSLTDSFYADVRDIQINMRTSSMFVSDLSTNSIDNLVMSEKKLKRMEKQIEAEMQEIAPQPLPGAENQTEPSANESPFGSEIFRPGGATSQSQWEPSKKMIFIIMCIIVLLVVVTAITVCAVRAYRSQYKNYIRAINDHIKKGNKLKLNSGALHKAAKAICSQSIPRAEAEGLIQKSKTNGESEIIGQNPIISVFANRVQADALVDTGANISSCSYDTALRSDAYIDYNTVLPAVAANGTLIPFVGMCYMNLQIGPIKKAVEMHVCDLQMDDVIIGTDIQELFGIISFDHSNKKAKIGDTTLPYVDAWYYYEQSDDC